MKNFISKFTFFGLPIIIIGFVLGIYLLSNKSSINQSNIQVLSYPNSYPVSYPISYTKPSPKEIKVLIVGDVMLARTIGQLIKNGKDPFENVKGFFKNYDLIIANLETNISKPGVGYPKLGKLYTFNAPLESIKSLKDSGISLVSLANNHTMDYGGNALIDEINNLSNKSIMYFGAGANSNEAFAPKFLTIEDTTISFIGVNDIENWVTKSSSSTPGSAYFDENRLKQSIKQAKDNSNIVIVVPHWGIEYNLSFTDRQKTLGRQLINDGADIVVGGHPHVVEPSETYNGKLIYYSMGNFVFDEMPSIVNAGKGYMVEIDINNQKITNSKAIYIKLNNQGFPSLL